MILGRHREALVGRIERRPLGHGPGLEHAVALEAEVVVQPRARNAAGRRRAAARCALRAPPAAGSGVALKLRLAEYSLSLPLPCKLAFRHAQILGNCSPARAATRSRSGRAPSIPEKIKPEDMLAFYAERAADGRDQQHVLPDAQGGGARELGAARRPRRSASRSRPRGASRTCRASRPTAPADSVAFLYRNLAALGAKRGPVLFQLPPFLKKDLPRLTEFLQPAARGPRRRVRVPQRHLVRRRRLRRAQGRGRGAVPFRARGQRAAAAGRDRAVGLRAAAAGNLLRRRPRAVGAQARRDGWREIYVYFMHEPTAPAYAQTLMALRVFVASTDALPFRLATVVARCSKHSRSHVISNLASSARDPPNVLTRLASRNFNALGRVNTSDFDPLFPGLMGVRIVAVMPERVIAELTVRPTSAPPAVSCTAGPAWRSPTRSAPSARC